MLAQPSQALAAAGCKEAKVTHPSADSGQALDEPFGQHMLDGS